MSNMRCFSITACAATLFMVSAGAMFAGEVAGPPGSEDPKATAAPDHAKSACSFSGLNDNDPNEGQTDSQVQTAADSFKFYGLPKGTPGTACRGNSDHSE